MSLISKFFAVIMSIVTSLVGFFSDTDAGIADLHDKIFAPTVMSDFEEKDENAIRVMSFNIRFGDLGPLTAEDRYPMVEETIRKGHPDSVGLQEATTEWMAYLTEALSDEYAHVGVGRDDGVSAGEHSAIFYLKDKYTAVDSGNFWLSETPDVPSFGWNAGSIRICTWVILENNETGEKYVHINSHFDNASKEARKNSVDMILEKAEEFGDLPVVFTADMNISEGSEDYNRITADGCLVDTKMIADNTMNYLTYHDRMPIIHWSSVIDFVMVNKNFNALVYKVVTAGIDGNYVSDHFPIYADIVIA